MRDKQEFEDKKDRAAFSREISEQAARKFKARRNTSRSVWFGLGMTGLIGWSVVVPTLLGTALGIWLDRHHSGKHSWTLTLLIVGLFVGCLNAWHWVAKEEKAIQEDQENGNE